MDVDASSGAGVAVSARDRVDMDLGQDYLPLSIVIMGSAIA